MKSWTTVLDDCVSIVKNDYLLTVKKAILKFSLQTNCLVDNLLIDYETPERTEALEISNNVHDAYQQSRNKLEKFLYIINPCIAGLLELWFKNYELVFFLHNDLFYIR